MNGTSISPSDSQKSRLALDTLIGQELPIWNVSNPIAPGRGTLFYCE